MKKFPILTVCVLSLSGFVSSVQADDINYDYVEVGYSLVNDSNATGGVTLSGSYDVFDNINVIGNLFISTTTDNTIADDVDVTSYTLGLGYHKKYSDTLDFFGEFRLLNSDSSGSHKGVDVNVDDTGHVLAVGVRSKVNDKVEFLGRLDRRNSDVASGSVFTFGARYKYNEKASLGLDFNTGASDGSETLTASIRWKI
jgi:hypothetical protein